MSSILKAILLLWVIYENVYKTYMPTTKQLWCHCSAQYYGLHLQNEVTTTRTTLSVANMIMPINEYQWWYDILVSDNITHLENNGPYNIDTLVNGEFILNTEHKQTHHSHLIAQQYPICKPLFLAVLHGSFETFRFLIEKGVDVLYKDSNGNNLLHCLVMVAHMCPPKESSIVCYLTEIYNIVDSTNLKLLYFTDNKLNLRPLEYAFHLATYDLALAMFDTRDIYLVKEWSEGIYRKVWYDVTDYETFDKTRILTPLGLLSMFDIRHVDRESSKRIIESQLIQNWIHQRTKLYFPVHAIFLIIQVIYHSMFVFMQMASYWKLSESVNIYDNIMDFPLNQNLSMTSCSDIFSINSPPEVPIIIAVIQIIMSLSLFMELILHISMNIFTWHRWIFYFLTEPKKPLLFLNLMYISLHVSKFGIIILSCLVLANESGLGPYNKTFINITNAITSIALSSTLLLDLQMFDFFSHFVMIFLKMMHDSLSFVLVTCIITTAFIFPFSYLANNFHESLCVEQFSGIIVSTYTLINAMFNVVNFSNVGIKDDIGLFIVHLSFIFLIVMLLLNLLIAIFSDAVSFVSKHKDIYWTVNRILLISRREASAGWVLKWVSRNKQFIIEDDKIFVECLHVMDNDIIRDTL